MTCLGQSELLAHNSDSHAPLTRTSKAGWHNLRFGLYSCAFMVRLQDIWGKERVRESELVMILQ